MIGTKLVGEVLRLREPWHLEGALPGRGVGAGTIVLIVGESSGFYHALVPDIGRCRIEIDNLVEIEVMG